jgi:hypothetical protein
MYIYIYIYIYIYMYMYSILYIHIHTGEMLCRLYSQIKANGILFLILPIRCINSKHVGVDQFNLLLNLVGFKHLIVKRITPKLVFYVLGRKDDNDIKNIDNDTINDTDVSTKKTKISKKNGVEKVKKDHDNGDLKNMGGWHDVMKSLILKNVEKGKNENVLRFFCKGYSDVPTGEFCISLASMIE